MIHNLDDERMEKRVVQIRIFEQGLIKTTGEPDVYIHLEPQERREFERFELKITKRDEARRRLAER